jgi:hypothetical protein
MAICLSDRWFGCKGTVLAYPRSDTIAMKAPFALLPLLLLGEPLALLADSPVFNENDVRIIRVENIGLEDLGYGELTAEGMRGERLTRVVAKASNGHYLVAVRSNIGILRMRGAYRDSTLQVEDGLFTFCYANGRVESTGHYLQGNKAGTWLRYAVDGTPLAERNYTGLDTDQMLVNLGVAEQAPTRTTSVACRKPRTGPSMEF